jgi:hypothetical protein
MKKITTFLAVSSVIVNAAFAQLNYSLTVSNPGFTQLVSPTNISDFSCACGDQIVSLPINIGFSFMFDGTPYTQFEVSDNGQLFLGAPAYTCNSNCGGTCNFSEIEPANLSAGSDRNVICPLWDDLGFNNCAGTINYQLSGTAGNQVMTIEWLLVDWKYNNNGNPHGTMSFQVKLYEAIAGQIDFIYKRDAQPLGIGTQAPHARIGLMGAAGDYYSTDETGVSPSKTTEFIVIAKPADGAQFRWTDASTASVKYVNGTSARIYPNPASNTITLDPSVKEISLIEFYTETGNKVYTNTNYSPDQKIDVSNLAPGIYFVKMYKKGMSSFSRFIKS